MSSIEPSSSAAESSLVQRVQDFIVDNKRAILIGTAAAVAVGGAAYFASRSAGPHERDVEKGEKKDKKKSKKKKNNGLGNKDGPILEERKPTAKVEDEPELRKYTAEEIAALSNEERTKLAATFKTKGNDAYKAKEFLNAVDLYTRAIQISAKPEPVFYSNRAACYMNIIPTTPENYQKVVDDCTAALGLDPSYVKALNRRATAFEHLKDYTTALRDFTAATILEKFTNPATGQSVERVLGKLSEARAKEIMAEREPRLPSHTFITAYFAAFRPRRHPELPEEGQRTTGDGTLKMALGALDAANYVHAFTLVNEAIEQGISWDIGKSEALNLRGTFKFLIGDVPGSKADLQASIDLNPSLTQTWVKIASVYMEQNDPEKAFQCFEDAIKYNKDDPDIYYHRGQVLFIMSQFTEAATNYTKSTELDPSFVFSHIQLAVAQYKSGNVAASMAQFRRTLKSFPTRSEPANYYGELLLDQQRYPDAVEKFDRAIELEKEKAASTSSPPNVLPLVNKSLALYQWKQDFAAAEQFCLEALELDSECDAAVASLAQFSLQQTKLTEAIKWLERQVELARTEVELQHTLTYYYATKAQEEFTKNYPALANQLTQMAQGIN